MCNVCVPVHRYVNVDAVQIEARRGRQILLKPCMGAGSPNPVRAASSLKCRVISPALETSFWKDTLKLYFAVLGRTWTQGICMASTQAHTWTFLLFFFFCIFVSFEMRFHYIALVICSSYCSSNWLELAEILLPLPPQCWNYRHGPQYPRSEIIFCIHNIIICWLLVWARRSDCWASGELRKFSEGWKGSRVGADLRRICALGICGPCQPCLSERQSCAFELGAELHPGLWFTGHSWFPVPGSPWSPIFHACVCLRHHGVTVALALACSSGWLK